MSKSEQDAYVCTKCHPVIPGHLSGVLYRRECPIHGMCWHREKPVTPLASKPSSN